MQTGAAILPHWRIVCAPPARGKSRAPVGAPVPAKTTPPQPAARPKGAEAPARKPKASAAAAAPPPFASWLVTGGSGFLGQAVVWRLLGMGVKVRVLDTAPMPAGWGDKVEFVQGDV